MGPTNARIRSSSLAIAAVLVALLPAPAPAAAADPAAGTVPTGSAAVGPGPLDGRPATTGGAVPDAETVIVKYRPQASPTGRARARDAADVSRERVHPSLGIEVVRPSRGQSVAAAVRALSRDPAVEYAEPNYTIVAAADPALEPLRATYQWGLENAGGDCVSQYTTGSCITDVDIDAVSAWQAATGAGITVAVLDDGLDFGAADLDGQQWVNPDETVNGQDDGDPNTYADDVNGVNLCPGAGPVTELHGQGEDWHGTAVASVIGAATNGYGMAGVAPDVRLMAVRWLIANVCDDTALAAVAIRYAVDSGADVINASWGSYSNSSTLESALAYANQHGVLIVAAAGNDSTTSRFYPAASTAPNVISVAAIRPDGYLATFSNRGSTVDLAAPGQDTAVVCVATGCSTGYSLQDGTSFAAPHVAGVAAQVLQVLPALGEDPAALRSKLISSGVRSARLDEGLTVSGRRLNAGYAVDIVDPSAPRVSVRARSGSAIGSTTTPTTISWAASTDASGIEGYRVRYRKTGLASWTYLTSWITGRSASVSLVNNQAYDVQVIARDRGANTVGTTVTTTLKRYSESSSLITYSGRWNLVAGSSYSGGYVRTASTAGRSATFTVSGRGVSWVAARGPTRGSAKVYVDGVYASTVSLYASAASYRRIVWSRGWTQPGAHTIKVVVSGTTGHPRVDIDALIVAK
ncbi:MAG TPA: S8 family serine peptidase [Candidatus Limnocylindrales bacterium]|nr:S8 family serine peptidase [Candidatus Limnocylindrales bacterium]